MINAMKITKLPTTVLNFWFDEISSRQWWIQSDEFDQQIRLRFKDLHRAAARCELHGWRKTALGALAEIIILDQFSRHIYRNTPDAFASDSLALGLAQVAIAAKMDLELGNIQRSFLYMPFMHSESREIHKTAVLLFSKEGMEETLDFELKHKDIIDRFGRYPHRNNILDRTSTPEEIDFLKTPGSSF